MQKTQRYLANNKIIVIANITGFITEYRPVYSRTLQVYRGIDNTLYFEVKNHDQKPVSLLGYTPKLLVFDENNVLILEKSGTILDDVITRSTASAQSSLGPTLQFASTSGIEIGQTVTGNGIKSNTLVASFSANSITFNKDTSTLIASGTELTFQTSSKKGVFTVVLTEGELLQIQQQYVKYVIYLVNNIGSKTLTYTTDHFDAEGIMYVNGNALPGPLESYQVGALTADSQSPTEWYSEVIDAQPALNGNSALHTIAFYTDQYNGDIIIQGTLENQITLNTFWADITTLSFTGNETEPVPTNFNGVYNYFRIKATSSPADKITKILVRN